MSMLANVPRGSRFAAMPQVLPPVLLPLPMFPQQLRHQYLKVLTTETVNIPPTCNCFQSSRLFSPFQAQNSTLSHTTPTSPTSTQQPCDFLSPSSVLPQASAGIPASQPTTNWRHLPTLHLRLRGVPTFRGLYCAPLANTIAPASNSRSHSRSFLCSACTCGSTSFLLKNRFCCGTLVENGNARAAHALAHLQEHDEFTVQPEALVGLAEVACNDTCESRDGCLYFGRL